MAPHKSRKRFAFAVARPLNQPTLFISITRGIAQALNPRGLEAISLWRMGIEPAGAEQEAYSSKQGFGRGKLHERGAEH
jgi:hypothetical protein